MDKLIKVFRFFLVIGLISIPDIVWACPNCYGAIADTEVAAGLRLAMLALVGVTGVVGTGIVFFFSNMKRRAGLMEHSESMVTPDGQLIETQDF